MKPELVAAIRSGAVNIVEELIAEELRLTRQNRDDWRSLAFANSDEIAMLMKRYAQAEGKLRQINTQIDLWDSTCVTADTVLDRIYDIIEANFV